MTTASVPAPGGITAHVHTPGAWYYVSWDPVAGGEVLYDSQHEGEQVITREASPRTALIAVARGTLRYTQIRNVVDGVASRWVRVTLSDAGEIVSVDADPTQPDPVPDPDPDPVPVPDPDPGPNPPQPAAPTGLHSHCVTTSGAKFSWDQSYDTDGFVFWIDGLREHTEVVTVGTDAHVDGLARGTSYTAKVATFIENAHGRVESAPASHRFTTLADVLPPDDPDHEHVEDFPAPTGLMVMVSGETTLDVWWDAHPRASYYAVTCDQRVWTRVEGTQIKLPVARPGEAREVWVYAVDEQRGGISGIARKGATTIRRA